MFNLEQETFSIKSFFIDNFSYNLLLRLLILPNSFKKLLFLFIFSIPVNLNYHKAFENI